MVKTRRLIDTVTGRPAKTGPYGSLAVGKGRDRRVIIVSKDVAKRLLDTFNDWMGKDRQSWFSGLDMGDDSPEGRKLRIEMAEVKSEVEYGNIHEGSEGFDKIPAYSNLTTEKERSEGWYV